MAPTREREKVIVTCAVTGAGLTPSMSPYLPVTPEQIVEQGVDAANAGAAILHLHARDPKDGRPTNDMGVWKEIVPELRKNTSAIINMSASLGATAEDRISAVLEMRPEIATVIVGSMNYGRFKKAQDQGIDTFIHDWEKDMFGPGSYEVVTNNTFAKIDRMIDMLIDADIAMEFECYDVGHLHILDYHVRRKGGLKRPLIIQFLTGILGGITSAPEHLLHMKQTAERLFGLDSQIFIHGTGPDNMRAATMGALLGTHLRIGQEDNVTERPGRLFKSNAEQVEKISRILEEFNIGAMDAAETRELLGLNNPVRA